MSATDQLVDRVIDESATCAHWHQELSSGTCHLNEEPCEIDLDLQYHIQHCPCSCNHLGYGNYLDYQSACVVENGDTVQCIVDNDSRTYRRNGGSRGSAIPIVDQSRFSSIVQTGRRLLCHRRRCIVIIGCIILFVIAIWLSVITFYSSEMDTPVPTTPSPSSLGPPNYTEIVYNILREVPLVDGHNDLPYNIRRFVHNQLNKVNLSEDLSIVKPWSTGEYSQTDLNRMRKGMVGAQFWSAYAPCPLQYKNALQYTLNQIDLIQLITESYGDHTELVTTPQGIREVHGRGLIASLIGVEGGHSIDESMGILRQLYKLGVRYITIAQNCDTVWASCCDGINSTVAQLYKGQYKGLSPFGMNVIREMNRMGMIVDLSHASEFTMRDTLNVSLAPVVFTHANAKALCNCSRNVPDDVLEILRENDGLIMITFYAKYVNCSERASLSQVIEHINYIRNIVGEDNIGIGAGYDGIEFPAKGLDDVSRYPDLFITLMQEHKWSEIQIKKLAGLNFLRIFEKIIEVSEELQKEGWKPSQDTIYNHLQPDKHNSKCNNHDYDR